jgi:hypothetical protein
MRDALNQPTIIQPLCLTPKSYFQADKVQAGNDEISNLSEHLQPLLRPTCGENVGEAGKIYSAVAIVVQQFCDATLGRQHQAGSG